MLGSKNLQRVQKFVCPRCVREGEGHDGNEDNEGPRLVANGGMLEEVEQFCFW